MKFIIQTCSLLSPKPLRVYFINKCKTFYCWIFSKYMCMYVYIYWYAYVLVCVCACVCSTATFKSLHRESSRVHTHTDCAHTHTIALTHMTRVLMAYALALLSLSLSLSLPLSTPYMASLRVDWIGKTTVRKSKYILRISTEHQHGQGEDSY